MCFMVEGANSERDAQEAVAMVLDKIPKDAMREYDEEVEENGMDEARVCFQLPAGVTVEDVMMGVSQDMDEHQLEPPPMSMMN